MTEEQTVTIDGTTYKLNDLSEKALKHVRSVLFCDQQIQQLQNELAVSDTARMGYSGALKRELEKAQG